MNAVYKGELVMPNPGTSGTAFLSLSAMMQIFGEEKGWELLDGSNKNAGQYTKFGSAKRFGRMTALDNLSFSLERGKLVTFVEPSGCGKTTLLRMISGLAEPSSGKIHLTF